ncbi:4-phosphoerythronate dehydrogenase [Spongiibacter tropicus]|uniref:4-phosphoerythronate dehydrogenase n=2 Tax=Spongiibacter tropicus TaxID=454602 RepID=UPI0003B39AF3|nr:4-phosphoerythronate dehydrogenase [Spongiibacter tropicus]
MIIYADENVPEAETLFAPFGELRRFAGRSLTAADLRDADALVVRSVTRVNAALLSGSPVRFVGSCTIGRDHLDTAFMDAQGIQWATAPGCNADSVVDYVVSVLCLDRQRWASLLSGERQVGIVAFGNVGRRLADRLAGLDIPCCAYDPLLAPTEDARLSSLDAVLACDVLCLHAPLTRGGEYPSFHMLDAAQLSRLPSSSLVVSAGRGEVVATEELLQLRELRPDIELALDVWEGEPGVSRELAGRCLIATPHIAGYSLDGKIAGSRAIAEQLLAHCQHRGLKAPAALAATRLPEPVVELSESYGAELLREAALAVYDPRGDDRRFRESLLADDPAAAFDGLRKHYPERREFAYCRYVGEQLDTAGFNLLAALQGSR